VVLLVRTPNSSSNHNKGNNSNRKQTLCLATSVMEQTPILLVQGLAQAVNSYTIVLCAKFPYQCSAGSAFGSAPAAGGTSLFGAPKPATGFGAFGGGGGGATFGSTSNFGQNTNAGASAFGQPSTSTSAFGSGGGLFGNNKPSAGFGTTQCRRRVL
jgi:hypothetical protein